MAEFYLKDVYSKDFYNQLAEVLKKHSPSFNKKKFLSLIFDGQHQNRELKERMHHAAATLNKALTGSYQKKISILKPTAAEFKNGLTGLIFPDFVEMFGTNEADYDTSIDALAHFTQFSSSEFAIRPFIIKYPKKTMAQLLKWASHENYHIRRLASEGCRSRLPWAMALPEFKKNPAPILPILELLKADKMDYVYRSVANNLNDISKDHPDLALELAQKWIGKTTETDWVVKHACRTLLKKGNQKAMRLFGFGAVEDVEISDLAVKYEEVKIGEGQEFSFKLKHSAAKTIKLRLEFGVYYMKSNGKQNRKVFQLSEKEYETNTVFEFTKKQHFKNLTTRKHYAGAHKIAIIVNGVEKSIIEFEVIK